MCVLRSHGFGTTRTATWVKGGNLVTGVVQSTLEESHTLGKTRYSGVSVMIDHIRPIPLQRAPGCGGYTHNHGMDPLNGDKEETLTGHGVVVNGGHWWRA